MQIEAPYAMSHHSSTGYIEDIMHYLLLKFSNLNMVKYFLHF